MTPRRTATTWAAIAIAGSLGLAGCERTAEVAASQPATSAPASVTVSNGPVRATLSLSPPSPRLSDEPTLTLTVVASRGATVTLPPFGSDPSNSGALRVIDVREPPEHIDAASGERTIERQLRLEPLESGDRSIAPITIAFHVDGDAEPHQLATEPLAFTIVAPAAGDGASLDRLRPPLAPSEIAVPHATPWVLISICGGLFVAGVAVFWMLLRRRRARPVAPPTAEELARRELERLLADDPSRRGELATFYVELTAIVRRYVERTTGIRAPEQTTEEFLRVTQSRGAIDRETRDRLVSFLEAADLVKFAAGRPSREDVDDAVARARRFCNLDGAVAERARAPLAGAAR